MEKTDKPKEEIVMPSMIGFDHRGFAIMVRDEIKHYGYENIDKKLYFNPGRIKYLINHKRAEFSFTEFKALNKLFNFY